MKKHILTYGFILVAASLIVAGCGPSKPTDEELKQLSDLQAEVASLEKRATDLREEIKKVEQSIAEKDAQIAETKKNLEAVNAQ